MRLLSLSFLNVSNSDLEGSLSLGGVFDSFNAIPMGRKLGGRRLVCRGHGRRRRTSLPFITLPKSVANRVSSNSASEECISQKSVIVLPIMINCLADYMTLLVCVIAVVMGYLNPRRKLATLRKLILVQGRLCVSC